MTAVSKRYFLMGMLGAAGVATTLCLGLAVFGGRRGIEGAMALGMLNGYGLVLILAAFTAIDHKIWRVVAIIGMILAACAMFLLSGYFVLREVFEVQLDRDGETVMQWLMTGLVTASLLCLGSWVGALRMATLGRWVQLGSLVSMLALYVLILVSMWRDEYLPGLEQVAGFVAVICGASTLGSFVLYKFFGLKLPDPLTALDQKLFLRCPRCLKEQEVPMGESHCVACNLRFTIDMEEPKCPGCGYNLRALTRPVCPECGRGIVSGVAVESV